MASPGPARAARAGYRKTSRPRPERQRLWSRRSSGSPLAPCGASGPGTRAASCCAPPRRSPAGCRLTAARSVASGRSARQSPAGTRPRGAAGRKERRSSWSAVDPLAVTQRRLVVRWQAAHPRSHRRCPGAELEPEWASESATLESAVWESVAAERSRSHRALPPARPRGHRKGARSEGSSPP